MSATVCDTVRRVPAAGGRICQYGWVISTSASVQADTECLPTVLGFRLSHFCFDSVTAVLCTCFSLCHSLSPWPSPWWSSEADCQGSPHLPHSALIPLFILLNFLVSCGKIDQWVHLCVRLLFSLWPFSCLASFLLGYWSTKVLCPSFHSACQLTFLYLNISCWFFTMPDLYTQDFTFSSSMSIHLLTYNWETCGWTGICIALTIYANSCANTHI